MSGRESNITIHEYTVINMPAFASEIEKLFAPLCTSVKSITTAESFDDVK